MKILRFVLILWLIHPVGASATVVPEGTGIMYDANYSFMMTAPKRWVLDNGVMKDQGVCAVFYPVGSSWKDSDAVFYVNTREKTGSTKSPEDAAKADVADSLNHGSPHAKAEKIKEMKLKKGRMASLWLYTGDQWGNYEETAFVVEDKGISAMVLSARSKKAMDGAIPAFERLVASYDYMGTVKITK